MKFQRAASRREQAKLNLTEVWVFLSVVKELKDIDPDYYISKLLKPRPPIVLIMEEATSLDVRIRESEYRRALPRLPIC
jgi:hypothetical protein